MDYSFILVLTFLASLCVILWHRNKRRAEVEAQFVITGTFLLIFYIVCFLSGVCTILNFIWRWIL